MLPRMLKNFILSIDGKGYAGIAEEIILPKLTLKTEEFQAGGMDVPVEIELGTEKLELEMTLAEYNPEALGLWGLTSHHQLPLTLRGSLENDEETQSLVVTMRGQIKAMDAGAIKASERTSCKLIAALRYYKLAINYQDIIEIDIENMIRKINGVDQLIERRKNLGI